MNKAVTPLILETAPSKAYALLDSGNGLKLERCGPYTLIRPEGQAFWKPQLAEEKWQTADAIFTGNTEEEGVGRWHFPKKPLQESWLMQWDQLPFLARFTSFRHVGIFPEQEPHWRFVERLIQTQTRPLKVLNLFGYTGLASLIAARAGAHVTHVDASKKAIAWARENQKHAQLEEKPIRWICEDALKFVLREERRGNCYDIILLDPPAYGRGPNNEVWRLFDHLPSLLTSCVALLSPEAKALILTAYTIRASFFALHELMKQCFAKRKGCLESGELLLRTKGSSRVLSTSLFSRWRAS